jgi:hypothetical protein
MRFLSALLQHLRIPHPYLTMALQTNFAKRTDVGNTLAPSTHPKGLASRLHNSINDNPCRHHTCTSGISLTSEYVISTSMICNRNLRSLLASQSQHQPNQQQQQQHLPQLPTSSTATSTSREPTQHTDRSMT